MTARRAAKAREGPRACRAQPAWREPGRGATCRAGRGAVPVVSGGRTTCDTAGAEWLAGQMSRDTPRLPHATAREYASIGQYRTTVRGLATLAGTRVAQQN